MQEVDRTTATRRARRRLMPAVLMIAVMTLSACASNGIIVESVSDYGPDDQLPAAVISGDGFLKGMLVGSEWVGKARYTNSAVYDTDFLDRDVDSRGRDDLYFDRPGMAISYFTGHGILADGCTATPCTSSGTCMRLGVGNQIDYGACRFSPLDAPRCCYMTPRALVTRSPFDKFNGVVNYTSGPVRFGESRQSGGWAGAGTNGGTNLVVLDISHGVLPPYWRETLQDAFAGVHLIATLMTAGGDTASVAERGPTFAARWAAAPDGNVAQAWLDTMAWLPSSLGHSCPGGGGGRGFNGCGCHIVVAMDATARGAANKMAAGWSQLRNDGYDGKGNRFYSARWLCNYRLDTGDQAAWVRP
ncbi:MAG: hypothetical protein KF823_01020 [Xanthomonadales bacterium]|nr:hypothetical protein [Xanthomonadales bacterium]